MERGMNFIKEVVPMHLEEPNPKILNKYVPKILLVSHGGFIMEFLNNMRILKGAKPLFNNSAKNCALFVIHFTYKAPTSSLGKAKIKLVPNIVLENDNSHLENKDFIKAVE